MHLIKLDATDSTNLYLKQMALKRDLPDYTVVTTEKQLNGRGQMGTNWVSEYGKNLTFSVLKKFSNFEASKQVLLNCSIPLAIFEVLQQLSVPNLKIKWPNDILSGNQKICGILIETVFRGNQISHAVIGIGLNVNQTSFIGLEKVSSLQLLLSTSIETDDLLLQLVERIKGHLDGLDMLEWKVLKDKYEQLLFRKDKPSTFENNEGQRFMGFIRGVQKDGKLRVELEDKLLQDFAFKEIRLLY